VAHPVGAAVVTKRVLFPFAQVGAKLVGLFQYLVGPHLSHNARRDTVVVASGTIRIPPIVRSGQVVIELAGGVADDMGQVVAGDPHETVLLVFVLEISEGGFYAGMVDQIVIALLVAIVVDRQSTRTLHCLARPGRRVVGGSGRRTASK
jgi:hypothetical protein